MLDDIIKVEDKVRAILEHYPATRDSDKLLWLAFAVMHCGLKDAIGEEAYIQLKQWMLRKSTPALESIRRSRQRIQQMDRSLAGDRKFRMDEAEVMRVHYAENKS